ncbi:MAG: cyclic nucleotide-binding domain-containing protein [Gammaproteobacteria bacterium]|jgi:CRP/FNR family cyclic AMP-dependent transcriptional regulator
MMEWILEYCDGLTERRVAPGEPLLLKGDRNSRLFILIDGEVAVSSDGVEINRQNEPGSLFGEMSALLKVPYTADVTALTDARVYEIEDGAEFLRSHPQIAFYVAKLLARRLKGASDYLVDVKKQFAGRDDHLGMVDEVLCSLLHQPDEECVPGSDREPDSTI